MERKELKGIKEKEYYIQHKSKGYVSKPMLWRKTEEGRLVNIWYDCEYGDIKDAAVFNKIEADDFILHSLEHSKIQLKGVK